MSQFTLDELCVVACAEAFRGDGEILASPIGVIPSIGARLARATFAPDLVISDGAASLIADFPPGDPGKVERIVEGWMPYRSVFDVVWSGRRHVMMGASQIDQHGNQNISCIGDFQQPVSQLLGMRGAPGNTINHPTSYWIPSHSTRVFVAKVDVVCGIGYDRAAALGKAASRFHEIRRVVSQKGVFDFKTPDGSMRILSVHPGFTVDDILRSTGFALVVPPDVTETRSPTDQELRLIREIIDPHGARKKELKA